VNGQKAVQAVKDGKGTSKATRRGILGGIGASGLAAAGVVFGQSTPASALVPVECCTLCYASTHDIWSCESGAYYAWGCYFTSGGYSWYCECCEHGTGGCGGGFQYSTAYCS
jgi:hypothetical protein